MRLPEMRQRLITLPRDVYDRSTYDNKSSKVLADPATTVVPVPMPQEWRGEKRFNRIKQSSGNEVFVLSSFDDTYVLIDEAMSHFALAKYNALAQLCGLLGAKSLTARELHEIDDTSSHSWALGGATLPATAKTQRDKTLGSKVSQSMKVHWDFSDKEADLEAAQSFLAETGLDGDPMIAGMVALRIQGRLTGHNWTVDLTNEGTKKVAFAAELGALIPSSVKLLDKLKLSLDRQNDEGSKKRLEVEVDLVFRE